MLGVTRIAPGHNGDNYVVRVLRALGWQRWAVVVLMTFLWTTRRLFTADMVDFFTPVEIAILGIELFAEMAVIAAALMLAYTLLDEALPRLARFRLEMLCAMLLGLSFVMTALLYAYYGHTLDDLPPAPRLFADSLRWSLPAVMLAAVAHVHRLALRTEVAANAEERSRAQLGLNEAEQQLALLQAQIEPHFLFNTLANVQALVESGSPQAAAVLKSLIAYLRAAMPQLNDDGATLGNELGLVRAYLELMHMRMPDRLRFEIRVPDELKSVRFPPMALLTLVENAIRHGIDPSEQGGQVEIGGQRDPDGRVRLWVADSGVGMSEQAAAGTGLNNVRARLRAFYGESAQVELIEQPPHGLRAELVFQAS
jgi:sensor histidine kinase YesM